MDAYDQRERADFNNSLRALDRAPLAERKEACAEFLDAMRTSPGTVAERIEWVIAGNYGRGAYDVAREVVANKRMNREAWLTQVVGALEWQCPQVMGIAAWKKLTPGEKKKLSAAVKKAIKYGERLLKEG